MILTFILYWSFEIEHDEISLDPSDQRHPLQCPHVKNMFLFTGIGAAFNILLGTLASWKQFANKYLHWNALGTWVLLFLQGTWTVRLIKKKLPSPDSIKLFN